MDELEKARAELLTRLKELFDEWMKAAEDSGGMLVFRADLMIEDILVASNLNDEKCRAFVFGLEEKGEKGAG